MQSENEINRVVRDYADMVRRICFYRLKNHADTEDVFQNVFLKYLLYEGRFESAEHEKAWFVRVSINACKDYLKMMFRHKTVPLEVLTEESSGMDAEQYGVLEALLELPVKYKDVLYLYYFEGYSALEIGGILKKKENTVYSLLSRGRGMLKERLGGEELGEPGL